MWLDRPLLFHTVMLAMLFGIDWQCDRALRRHFKRCNLRDKDGIATLLVDVRYGLVDLLELLLVHRAVLYNCPAFLLVHYSLLVGT